MQVCADAAVDPLRLTRAGLRSHDRLAFMTGFNGIVNLVGPEDGENLVAQVITEMIGDGQFYFVDEETGEPSPLL